MMLLSEYIKVLQDTLALGPDLEVVMTEEGYYSESEFANLYDKPEVYIDKRQVATPIDPDMGMVYGNLRYSNAPRNTYYALGHSYQNP